MDHRDWTVGAVNRPEKRQSDCVITSEGNDSGQSLSILCWTFLFRIRRWSAAQDGVVSFFNLVKSPGIVIPARQSVSAQLPTRIVGLRCDWDVSTV